MPDPYLVAPVLVTPPPLAPLSWRIDATTREATEARLDITDSRGHRQIVFPGLQRTHRVPVLGISAGETADVSVSFVSDAGSTLLAQFTLQQMAVAGWWPDVVVGVSDAERMEPGLTVLPLASGNVLGWVAALDASGTPAWLYGPTPTHTGVRFRPETGTLRMVRLTEVGLVEEIDLFGGLVNSFGSAPFGAAIPLDGVERLHHEVLDLGGGTFAALDTLPVVEADYPASYVDPLIRWTDVTVSRQQLVVVGADGAVEELVPLTDVLDPGRLGYDGLDKLGWGLDWAHANALAFDAADDAWVVSLRNQDTVFAMNRDTHELLWLLAPEANWGPEYVANRLTPVGEDWRQPYHAHGITQTPQGTWLLFDNGDVGASPWTEEVPADATESLAIELKIDAVARTVERIWSYEPADGPLAAPLMGAVDALPTTGNRLVTYGWLESVGGVSLASQGLAPHGVRVVELVMPDTVVWQVDITVPADDAASDGVQGFAAHRIPSLYGGGAVETWD